MEQLHLLLYYSPVFHYVCTAPTQTRKDNLNSLEGGYLCSLRLSVVEEEGKWRDFFCWHRVKVPHKTNYELPASEPTVVMIGYLTKRLPFEPYQTKRVEHVDLPKHVG